MAFGGPAVGLLFGIAALIILKVKIYKILFITLFQLILYKNIIRFSQEEQHCLLQQWYY